MDQPTEQPDQRRSADVGSRAEIRDFLATRRARISPEQVGLPAGGGRRRVPGLRREEVAVLAGVSPDYYTRLEKGHIRGVSDDVLDAVARALQLTEAEQNHVFNLARAANPARRPRSRPRTQIPASLQRVLDSMTGTAAFVRNGRLDLLATNQLSRALYSPVLDEPAHRGNIARFNFLDSRAADYFPDFDGSMRTTVALLRTEAGRDPHDKQLTDLVGELATRSAEFRTRWAAHDVRTHRGGRKQFRHPVVGYLELDYDAMELPAAPGLVLTAFSAEPGTASADALALLASWAATTEPPAEALAQTPIPTQSKPSNEGESTWS